MLENQSEIKKITSSLIRYFDSQSKWDISKILKESWPSSMEIGYDNWNGGTYIYALVYEIEVDLFLQHRALLEPFCNEIREAAELFIRNTYNEQLGEVRIVPLCKQYLNWNQLPGGVSKRDILERIGEIGTIMIDVATGGQLIKSVDAGYKERYAELDKWLNKLGLDNPNPYRSLWDWYERWNQSDDLNGYASRRVFVSNLYQPLVEIIENSVDETVIVDYEPTGWDRVDRTVYEMKNRLASATTEEQFQVIGVLGRETMITVAQQVFDRTIHKSEDGIEPSTTDAKRMLDAFLGYELSGASNERTRKFAKSSVDMANHLTHDRTATKRDASMYLVSVSAVASLIKIIQGDKEDWPF